MAKTLVTKDKIATDPCLTIIKAFRIANKRAGEAKQALVKYQSENPPREALPEEDSDIEDPEETRLYDLYKGFCDSLKDLAEKAEAAGFHIWVNHNGHTGHDYAKDYKPTPSADNNWAVHQHRIDQMQAAVSGLFPVTPNPNMN
jgi:hypothetical protein